MCQIKENLQTFPLATDKLGHLNTPTTYRNQKSQILVIIGTVQIGRSKSSFHSIPFFFKRPQTFTLNRITYST